MFDFITQAHGKNNMRKKIVEECEKRNGKVEKLDFSWKLSRVSSFILSQTAAAVNLLQVNDENHFLSISMNETHWKCNFVYL